MKIRLSFIIWVCIGFFALYGCWYACGAYEQHLNDPALDGVFQGDRTVMNAYKDYLQDSAKAFIKYISVKDKAHKKDFKINPDKFYHEEFIAWDAYNRETNNSWEKYYKIKKRLQK